MNARHKQLKKLLCLFIALNMTAPCRALQISNRYSPRNAERPRRKSTRYIILHTTEGPTKGSLDKVRKNGECHYFVTPGGHAYRIIERSRVAYHAGRSMWEGKTNIDQYALGIEIVGFHNRDITSSQYRAVQELLAQLKRIYRVPDERVIPHSMVAYGAPNRWHRHSHRGRKRCGMCFAKPATRAKLGLTSQPMFDPDVNAGRLVVADPFLQNVLFGNIRERENALKHFDSPDATVISASRSAWDIARDQYRSAETRYVFPNGTIKRGNQITDWKAIPPGTRVLLHGEEKIAPHAEESPATAGDAFTLKVSDNKAQWSSTIYFLPDKRIRRGDELSESELAHLPKGTRILTGYIQGGRITQNRSAFDICGEQWNDHDTIYRLPDGTFTTGNQLNENSIPGNTHVFFKD